MASSTNTTLKSLSPFLHKDMKVRVRIGLLDIVVYGGSNTTIKETFSFFVCTYFKNTK